MMEVLPKFFAWYFIDMVQVLLKIWKNFLLFNLNYFSIPTLLKTFFSHWHRYYSPYSKRLDLWQNFENLVFNIMSRIIGIILRIVLIIIGVLLEVLVAVLGVIALIFWLFLPLMLVGGFLFGFKLLFF